MDVNSIVSWLRSQLSKDNPLAHKKIFSTLEKELLKQVIEEFRLNQYRASLYLGISRTTLNSKLKQYFGDEYNTRSF
jgi:DNA-binding protein Fis